MESYPSEFTFHHIPLLFVAGLNLSTTSTSTSTPQSSNSPLPSNSTSASNNAIEQPVDEFTTLIQSLRKTLNPKKPFQIWDNSRGVEFEFHTVLVEKVSIRSSTEYTYIYKTLYITD